MTLNDVIEYLLSERENCEDAKCLYYALLTGVEMLQELQGDNECEPNNDKVT